jgi:hypothetical protein
MDCSIRRLLVENLVVSIPQAGAALGYGRSGAYDAVRRGDIPTVNAGQRRKKVPTAWIRQQVGLDRTAAE